MTVPHWVDVSACLLVCRFLATSRMTIPGAHGLQLPAADRSVVENFPSGGDALHAAWGRRGTLEQPSLFGAAASLPMYFLPW